MGTDYSRRIFGDILKPFRTCVFCDQKNDLSRVAVDAYQGMEWHYFHEKCKDRVLEDPESFAPLVDIAVAIETEIGTYKYYENKAASLCESRRILRQEID